MSVVYCTCREYVVAVNSSCGNYQCMIRPPHTRECMWLYVTTYTLPLLLQLASKGPHLHLPLHCCSPPPPTPSGRSAVGSHLIVFNGTMYTCINACACMQCNHFNMYVQLTTTHTVRVHTTVPLALATIHSACSGPPPRCKASAW